MITRVMPESAMATAASGKLGTPNSRNAAWTRAAGSWVASWAATARTASLAGSRREPWAKTRMPVDTRSGLFREWLVEVDALVNLGERQLAADGFQLDNVVSVVVGI